MFKFHIELDFTCFTLVVACDSHVVHVCSHVQQLLTFQFHMRDLQCGTLIRVVKKMRRSRA